MIRSLNRHNTFSLLIRSFLIALLAFLFFRTQVVFAQGNTPPGQIPSGVTPQKVRANFGPVTQSGGEGAVYMRVEAYIEFWNVGALGGDAYKDATVYLTIAYEDEGTSTVTYNLEFSGGPDGVFTVTSGPNVTSGSPGELTSRAINDLDQVWIPKRMSYERANCQTSCFLNSGLVDSPWFYFENCDAFSGWFTDCTSCSASMSWDANLKTGDILAPSITYVGPNGQPVDIIGQALYINGQETWSIVWDGKPATLELQYTCTDNMPHILTLTVPAAGSVVPPNPPSSQPPDQGANTTTTGSEKTSPGTPLQDLIKSILISTGVVSVGTGGVILVRKLISAGSKTKPPVKGTTGKETVQKEPVKTAQKSKLSQQERAELTRKKAELDARWKEIKSELVKREKQHLRVMRNNTSNRFKVMVKKAIETHKAITGPEEYLIQETAKALSGKDIDKFLYDIDNKKDVDLLTTGKQCQAALKNYIGQLKQELLKTGREHSRIANQLKEE